MLKRLLKKLKDESYKRGYNDAKADIEDLLDKYESDGVYAIGIITLRNIIIGEL